MDTNVAPSTTTGILHDAAGYDLMLWLATLGNERSLRERILRLAGLAAGETVLDVGCGTGTLAVTAKRQVGFSGAVFGIDASQAMISRARAKARKARLAVSFDCGVAEALPFSEGRFDAVLSTIMLHHLPRAARGEAVREMRRVLRPRGRILAVDFEGASTHHLGPLVHLHRRHGHVTARELRAIFEDAGLDVIEYGDAGIRNLHFVLATKRPDIILS